MNRLAQELLVVAKGLVAGDKLLATNQSFWQWEYDRNSLDASVYVDDRGNLRYEILETHVKSGLGAGTQKAMKDDGMMGTLYSPRLGMVQGLLKKYGHERSRAGGPFQRTWLVAGTNERLPLAAILAKEIERRAEKMGVQPGESRPPRAAPEVRDPQARKELLMNFVRSMKPDEVEKAFAAVLGMRGTT